MDQHRRILGILFIVLNALTLLAAVALAAVFALGIGVVSNTETDSGVAVMALTGLGLAGCLTLMGLPGVITGIGLLKGRGWSRVAALVLGVLGLLNFPLGTALGVYALWFYLQPESARVFE